MKKNKRKKELELKIGKKSKNVNWKVSETLVIIKNYGLIKTKDYGLKRSVQNIERKKANIGLSAIKKKNKTNQKKVNDRIYNYIVKIVNDYNKNRKIDLDHYNSIPKRWISIIKNCFPKSYFDRMMKETKLLNFIEKNKRLPRMCSSNKKEVKLGMFLNIEQFQKKDLMLIAELEKVKYKVGIKSKIGEAKPKAEETMGQLVTFIKKNKRMPYRKNGKALSEEEKKLANFFGATCSIKGTNPRPDLAKPHLKLFLKYMTHPSYKKTRYFFEGVLSGKIEWVRGKKIGLFYKQNNR